MLRHEATDLAIRIGQCFNGPPVDVWEDDLGPLDAGRAGTALARLRREHEHRWLSIAQFMNMYRAIHTDDPSSVTVCGDCDNTGWVEAPNNVLEAGTDHERRYTAVKPCRCSTGSERERSTVWKARSAA